MVILLFPFDLGERNGAEWGWGGVGGVAGREEGAGERCSECGY